MTKKNSRRQQYVVANEEFFDEDYDPRPAKVKVKPRNDRQTEYMRLLDDRNAAIVFATGPAGTGKTMLAVHRAVHEFKERNVRKIVITRPAVTVDEDHGFLPGDLIEKMAPWMRPMMDIFHEHFSPTKVQTMLKYEHLEISPLAYMRGRTFKESFIIADEMQNSTHEQMKMLLTRIGDGSRMVVTGDLEQHDRKFKENGLADFTGRLDGGSKLIREIVFERQHIERHPVVSEVLDIYGDGD